MTCIANSPEDAQGLFDRTVRVLDNETNSESRGVQAPLLDRYLTME